MRNRTLIGGMLFVCMIAGCIKIFSPVTSKDDAGLSVFGPHKIKVIDSCEYIETTRTQLGTQVYSLTHKGNCKNPIHTNEKILGSNKPDDTLVYGPFLQHRFYDRPGSTCYISKRTASTNKIVSSKNMEGRNGKSK